MRRMALIIIVCSKICTYSNIYITQSESLLTGTKCSIFIQQQLVSIIIVGNAGFRIDITGVVLLQLLVLKCICNCLLVQRPIHICCLLVHIFHICVNTRNYNQGPHWCGILCQVCSCTMSVPVIVVDYMKIMYHTPDLNIN